MPRQFRESQTVKRRERWPIAFDIEGVPRDTQARKQLELERKLAEQNQQQEPDTMPKSLTPNSFVAGAVIDLNRPPKEAYNPRDPKNQYPKILYHPTEKNPLEVKELQKIQRYNALHPEKPEVLPPVSASRLQVNSKEEEAAALKKGWALRAPKEKSEEQTEAAS